MKILNAIHAQSIGGVDQVFRNYTEVLVKNNHEVALLISANGHESYQTSGVKRIFKLKNFSQIADFLNLFWILLSLRPDVVFCHSNRLMKWMRILKFFTFSKSIAVNHGISFQNSLHCDYVISINQQIADLVGKAGFNKNKSFILPNVIKIDQNYFAKSIKNPPQNPLVIGIYGRIEMRKGFDILIKAGEILAQKNINFRFKIGGFEVEKFYGWREIKDLAKTCGILDKCDFVGVVSDKKNFFADVDIFCVPSREEPFGLVILESFLHSTLVISSNTDGGKFLIDGAAKPCGLLFENENFADLAEKIIDVYFDSSAYKQLTNNAFLRLEKEFSFAFLEQEIDKILKIIKNDSH
jgi:glycosyltransferase involved in cell wall biosynthesis